MAFLLQFPKAQRVTDIEFAGSHGFFAVYGHTDAGIGFHQENLSYLGWLEGPQTGITIEDARLAVEIAQDALDDGCCVRVNGKEI